MDFVLKAALKTMVRGIFLMAAFPCAAAAAFGRWEPAYTLFAQGLAMALASWGDDLRVALYN